MELIAPIISLSYISLLLFWALVLGGNRRNSASGGCAFSYSSISLQPQSARAYVAIYLLAELVMLQVCLLTPGLIRIRVYTVAISQ